MQSTAGGGRRAMTPIPLCSIMLVQRCNICTLNVDMFWPSITLIAGNFLENVTFPAPHCFYQF